MLLSSGELYTMGNGEQGQLGRVGDKFTHRGGRRGLGLLLTPAKVPVKRGRKFTDVWAGGYDTLAVTEDGKVMVMGLNNYKQLGDGLEQVIYMPEVRVQNTALLYVVKASQASKG